MRLSLSPFAWGLGFSLGAAVAFSLGAYGPSWGDVLAFLSVTLLFSIGSWKETDGDEITHLLRLSLAFTIAFLIVSMPITLSKLAHLVQDAPRERVHVAIARTAELRAALWPRWGAISLSILPAIVVLVLRGRRAQKEESSDETI